MTFCALRVAGVEPAADEKPAVPAQLQREGSLLVDVIGHFKMSGGRATFFPLNAQRGFAGLENLNLERVTQMIDGNSDKLTWQVSGTVTEFQGNNHLLVSKAVLRNAADTSEIVHSRPAIRTRPAERKTGERSGGNR